MKPARALVVLAIALCSCGVKGDPRPPLKLHPGEAAEIMVLPREDHILLTWKAPMADSIKKRTEPVAFIVERKVYIAYNERWSSPEAVAEVKGPFPDRVVSWRDYDVRKGAYAYRIISIDADGRRGEPTEAIATVWGPPPGAPKIVKTTPGDRTVSLEWSPPADGADGYYVYRDSGDGFVRISQFAVPVTNYFDAGLSNGATYKYMVRATRQSGSVLVEGPPSEAATVSPVDTTSPMVPVGVDAFPVEGGVLVRWWPNEEDDLKGYNVYRKEAKTFEKINAEPVAEDRFMDSGAKTGKTYYYTVSAVDDSGNESPRSEQAKVYVKR